MADIGAKGIGELPHDGPAPAILNAIRDATGVAFNAIPLLPEDLYAGLASNRRDGGAMSKGERATPSERWPAISFNVNGESRIVNVPPMKRLLDVLREDLHLTGTKEGCGEGECGSCSVRMNGELVNSCLVPVLQAEGAEIQTVEGLALDGELHPLQKAFLEHGGAQCGICTPGMLMAAAQLLEHNPHPGIVRDSRRRSPGISAAARDSSASSSRSPQRSRRKMPSRKPSQQHASHDERSRLTMRGNAATHELVAPGELGAVLDLLAAEPGEWTPIAGGTELMVAFAAGRLTAPKLVNLWGIPDLRTIEVTPQSVVIGAAATFLDLRRHAVIASDLPLLAKAASWIGSIANQGRATLGGNLVNGSPAADSSPALLAYDAEIEFISVRGRRRVPYSEFHTAYKCNCLAPDELLYAIHLPRRFAQHRQYLRKVGTRRAMAIAKVALGATALLEDGVIREIRLGAASLAPFPMRLLQTEAALLGQTVTPDTIQSARRALLAEVKPIDDIRSTAEYRQRVAANLLDEFLLELRQEGSQP